MKLIKTFLLTALLTSSNIANAQCSFKDNLNSEQITAAQKIYHTAKYYDLGVTAIAVSYQGKSFRTLENSTRYSL